MGIPLSILLTMNHIPNMKEKTLRYPKHASLMKDYKEKGLFNVENINDTSEKLFKEWKLKENEEEFTIMDILIEGKENRIEYHLYDEFNIESNTTSMARTTGYTATATINLILDTLWTNTGVFPPETIGGKEGCLDFILSYLNDRNISVAKK